MVVEQASRQAVGLVLGLGLLLSACGDADPAEAAAFRDAAPGILFEDPHLELGEIPSGAVREVEFPFTVVGEAVQVQAYQSSCGCVSVELRDERGEVLPNGQPLSPGTRGILHALWSTAGYSGTRTSTIKLLGEGPGLPVTVRFQGSLQPWFEVEPTPVEFPVAGREEEQRLTIAFSAPEPFRLLDVARSAVGVRVEGLPSEQAATRQELVLIREANVLEEGIHGTVMQFRTDYQGYVASAGVRIPVESPVYLKPASRWLLGPVQAGTTAERTAELGARRGELEILELRTEGPEGVSARLVTEEPMKRFRLELDLPAGLASGSLRGTIHLRLAHRDDGRESLLEREIRFVGLVSDPSDSESQER